MVVVKRRESACVSEQGVGEGESRGDEAEGDEEDRLCARLVGQRAHRRVVESCTHKLFARRRLQSVRNWRKRARRCARLGEDDHDGRLAQAHAFAFTDR